MDKEFYILNFIRDYISNPFLDFLMPFISFLGSFGLIWIVLFTVLIITKKYRSLGRSLASNFIFNFIGCNLIIKPIVARIRPYELNQSINLLVSAPNDYSFPSGHTLFAFGAATIIFLYNKKIGSLMYLFALLMGFSRLYLYVHFPTDVAFGAFLGIIFATVSYRLEKMIFDKKPELKLISNTEISIKD